MSINVISMFSPFIVKTEHRKLPESSRKSFQSILVKLHLSRRKLILTSSLYSSTF